MNPEKPGKRARRKAKRLARRRGDKRAEKHYYAVLIGEPHPNCKWCREVGHEDGLPADMHYYSMLIGEPDPDHCEICRELGYR